MKRLSLVTGLVFALSLALVGGVGAQANSVTVTLNTQNNSGVSGTATLTDMNGQTQVVVNVTGEPAGGSEPEHIHVGSCPTVGAVKYPLANVVNGTATTMVNVKLADLQTGGFAINLHKSAAQAGVYIACGDIPAATNASNAGATTAATASTMTASAVTPSAAPATGGGGMATMEGLLALVVVLAGGAVFAALAGKKRAS